MPLLSHSHRSTLWGIAALLLLAGLVAALLTMDEDSTFLDAIPFGPARAKMVTSAADTTADDIPLDSLVPSAVLTLSPEDALARNLALPLSRTSNPLAPPFSATWLGSGLERSTVCLANAVYYEANGEPISGQRAVAQVVLNRLRHPRFPKTICDVVYQGAERTTGCQFSFTCDGSLSRVPNPARFKVALGVATTALEGWTSAEAGQATHYHTLYVFPKWAPELLKTGILGHHIFYRLPGRFYDYAAFRAAAGTLSADAGELPLQIVLADTALSADSGVRPEDITGAAPLDRGATSGTASEALGTAPAGASQGGTAPATTPTPEIRPKAPPAPRSYFPSRRSSRPHLPLAQ